MCYMNAKTFGPVFRYDSDTWQNEIGTGHTIIIYQQFKAGAPAHVWGCIKL